MFVGHGQFGVNFQLSRLEFEFADASFQFL